ncbi:MAG: ferritin-like domain-containing protein [Polyangiaceae bacterium]
MNPYAPPVAAVSITEKQKRTSSSSWVFFAASIGVSVAALLATGATESTTVGTIGFSVAALVALVGAISGIRAIGHAISTAGATSTSSLVLTIFAVLSNLFMTATGALFALLSTSDFTRGRQLRRFGRVLLPEVTEGTAWAHLPIAAAVENEATRLALAAQWRENGRTEHASVAAFAKLTLDLLALGAPPALIAGAQQDALDEIRHAELCFSLARGLDGEAHSPSAFRGAEKVARLSRTRSLALAELAVDSLIDGALHEGVSARIIAKLARRCEMPVIQAILKEIAADEGRHAAHGWDVVLWCVSEGRAPVASALLGALRALPDEMKTPLPAAAALGAWEKYGIHGHALEASEYQSARSDLVRRVEALAEAARLHAA